MTITIIDLSVLPLSEDVLSADEAGLARAMVCDGEVRGKVDDIWVASAGLTPGNFAPNSGGGVLVADPVGGGVITAAGGAEILPNSTTTGRFSWYGCACKQHQKWKKEMRKKVVNVKQ